MNKAVRKRLGVPRCLSTVSLNGNRILELPLTSSAEEFKCAKTSLEITFSKKAGVKITAP